MRDSPRDAHGFGAGGLLREVPGWSIRKLVDSVLDQRARSGVLTSRAPPQSPTCRKSSPSVPYPDADFYYTRKRRKRRRSNAALHKDRERAVADLLTKAALVRDKFEAELQRPDNDWATCLDPWNRVVEASRRAWGERWAHYVMATTAAGIKSRDPVTDASDLYDRSSPLCSRARLARLRAGHPDWWRRQPRPSTDSDGASVLHRTGTDVVRTAGVG